MWSYSTDMKDTEKSILKDLPSHTKNFIIIEETEITKLLEPIKNKINEISLSKGPTTLITSILEFFYEKKRKILSEEEIFSYIKSKLDNNKINVIEKINQNDNNRTIIGSINSNNYFSFIDLILSNNQYFTKLIVNEKEFIQLNNENIKKSLNYFIKEFEELNNIFICNKIITIEIEEDNQNKNNQNNNKLNSKTKIKHNNDINFSNIHNNHIIINTDLFEKNELNEKQDNKIVNNNIIKINQDITNEDNLELKSDVENKKEIKNNKYISIKTDLEIKNKTKKKKNNSLNKTFLKKKKKPTNNKSITSIPYSNNNYEIISNTQNQKNSTSCTNNFSVLSMESLSFSCIPGKKEKYILEQIVNYITTKNKELLSVFNVEKLKEREEKKIRELNQEISQKSFEIKIHEYIIQCWKNTNINLDKKLDNVDLIKNFNEEIKKDYKILREEMDILYATHFILNKRKADHEINVEGIQKDFNNNYNTCIELYKKIENHIKVYLSCLNSFNEFIKNVNIIKLNIKEKPSDKVNINDIFIYKEEKKSIDNIIDCLNVFKNLIKKHISKCLINTPFESNSDLI